MKLIKIRQVGPPLMSNHDVSAHHNLYNMTGGGSMETYTAPAVNILNFSNHYAIQVFAPGLDKSVFDLSLDAENRLVLQFSPPQIKLEDEAPEYLRKEFSFRSTTRKFELPDGVDENEIKAQYDQGILNIRIPKITTDSGQGGRKTIAID